ncbi:hypothetical protein NIES37_72700 (plasmid) [Tolypothrix tenuis PCC 7101]|uniref:Uncharacterized protein n=1 Tax=Tolypothrix tenuis PCC 7101 TaxID=231146 RepID=A0A1Z4NC09_9CYAN|nr:hypothetical protein [Aulosira sp. FACHB-113]BAZ03257.1 hypothetical protein NIES37_72700 [Tolypothrix tenuis PCC 7101]BAZ78651.1 hypothetical protein NIES50_72840 [Aulosira laxa NIES-50]
MPELSNSSRTIQKATYVPLKMENTRRDVGNAVLKFGFVRQLALQMGEVDMVRSDTNIEDAFSLALDEDKSLWTILQAFEGSPLSSKLPSPSVFATVPHNTLIAFGNALAALRQQTVDNLQMPETAVSTLVSEPLSSDLISLPTTIRTEATNNLELGRALTLLNSSIISTKSFAANVTATPIGMLNLERLEMTPAGIERGELIATIPLAPGEQTAVVQKEWSVTSQEFTSIVTDSLDNYSETGVTENTELSQATNSQTTHSNQFNITSNTSGGIGFVTESIAASFGIQDQTSASAADSRKHAKNTTSKASARVKQSHKVTISTSTVSGSSETSTRMLKNTSTTDPIRIDYFSMMRKWHVGLYRYGLRLTYDIVIPEPGATLRKVFARLDELQKALGQSFVFSLYYSDINEGTYQDLASQYRAQVPPPPIPELVQTIGGQIPGLTNNDNDQSFHFNQLNFTVPEGYAITNVTMEIFLSNVDNTRPFYVFGSPVNTDLHPHEPSRTVNLNKFMQGLQGSQVITYFVQNAGAGAVTFTITQHLTAQAYEQWVATVWNALFNAAQTKYYTRQQALSNEIAALNDQIARVDTLTLRREENDEIMKGVLHWLLGPTFDFMPSEVTTLFNRNGNDLTHGIAFTSNDLGLTASSWITMMQYQEMVKFINEAIEWENVIYFPYSYFWDVPQSWDFIRTIRYPDATRQAFLRAGSARVVLTVRKGFEEAWMSFVELGDFGLLLPPGHPYLTIAQEIAAYDRTNYPGIPPANPNGGSLIGDGSSVATTSEDRLEPSTSPITLTVVSSVGFVVGYSVIIDSYASRVQETQTIVSVPDNTHITVTGLSHTHDGSETPFPLMQTGEKGLLIAEWFEYTPSSGTDIAVTSNLATIA